MMNRLKELREDIDLPQREIAKVINMSQTGYSKYEVGTNDIPTEILYILADYYDTSIDYLLYRTDERKPYPVSLIRQKKEKMKDMAFIENKYKSERNSVMQ